MWNGKVSGQEKRGTLQDKARCQRIVVCILPGTDAAVFRPENG